MNALRIATIARRAPAATRTFVTTARLQSGGSHVSNNDPEVLEREKNRSLHQKHDTTAHPHKDHAPGWNESLGSVSEAYIKADQAPIKSPEELQKVTVEFTQKKHHSGPVEAVADALHDAAEKVKEVVGMDTDKSHTSAPHERDEIEGPLAGKGKKH